MEFFTIGSAEPENDDSIRTALRWKSSEESLYSLTFSYKKSLFMKEKFFFALFNLCLKKKDRSNCEFVFRPREFWWVKNFEKKKKTPAETGE